ncbi:MAG: flagellin [Acidobacteriota bacterium]
MASFSVVNNIASVNAQARLYETNVGLQRTLGRLSSGLRINQSADDAAGLAVANKFRSDIAILNVGVRNANDAISRLQIIDGATNNISQLLDRAAVLATQAASEGNEGLNRTVLNDEFQKVLAEIDREAGVAKLNVTTNFTVYVSSEATQSDGTIHVSFSNQATASALGVTAATTNISTVAAAQSAITALSAAISTLGTLQGAVGSAQNRLQFAVSLANSQIVNKSAAESRLRDANIAEESANLTRYNILTQSGLASLAQANQTTASVLSLLR